MGFDKVVCIATWSFQDPCGVSTTESMVQFACAFDTATELEKRGDSGTAGIRVFAQDPLYTPLDIEFLSRRGVTVLKMDPLRIGLNVAKDHMGPQALLFEFFVTMNNKPLIEDLYASDIGMRVGTPSRFLNREGHRFEDVEMGNRFNETHVRCEFPEFKEDKWAHGGTNTHRAFDGLNVHWRETSEQASEAVSDSMSEAST